MYTGSYDILPSPSPSAKRTQRRQTYSKNSAATRTKTRKRTNEEEEEEQQQQQQRKGQRQRQTKTTTVEALVSLHPTGLLLQAGSFSIGLTWYLPLSSKNHIWNLLLCAQKRVRFLSWCGTHHPSTQSSFFWVLVTQNLQIWRLPSHYDQIGIIHQPKLFSGDSPISNDLLKLAQNVFGRILLMTTKYGEPVEMANVKWFSTSEVMFDFVNQTRLSLVYCVYLYIYIDRHMSNIVITVTYTQHLRSA